jgi:hypothetical protein
MSAGVNYKYEERFGSSLASDFPVQGNLNLDCATHAFVSEYVDQRFVWGRDLFLGLGIELRAGQLNTCATAQYDRNGNHHGPNY